MTVENMGKWFLYGNNIHTINPIFDYTFIFFCTAA